MSFRAELRIDLPQFETDIQFSAKSEVVVLFGPSGSGKSVTLRAIAGLVKPREGRLILNGTTLFDSRREINLPPQSRHVGYMPQDYALFPHRSVAENIAYGLHALPRSEVRTRVSELVSLMGLNAEADRRPGEISGGQRQRTALARALATRPSLLLMDEPFAAVEEPLRDVLAAELINLHRRYAIPVILVTHDLDQALTLADQLVVIEDGATVQSGPAAEVFHQPAKPSIAKLMGMVNIMQGVVIGNRAPWTQVSIDGTDQVIDLEGKFPLHARLRMGVRPEALAPSQGDAGGKTLSASVIEIRRQGLDTAVKLQVGSIELEALFDDRERSLQRGQHTHLRLDPTLIHVFPEP